MSESIETAVETAIKVAPRRFEIQLGIVGMTAVASLATYGAVSVTRDVAGKAKQFKNRWDANKAARQAQKAQQHTPLS